jgi:hypothetical protein
VLDANLVHVIWIKLVPQIVAVTHPSANTAHVQGQGAANAAYKLEMSSSPAGSGFTTSVNVTADANGIIAYDDNASGTRKFYRLTIP